MSKDNIYWGDFHKHLQDLDNADAIVESARDNLDFYPLLCYPFVWFLQNESGGLDYLGQPSDLSDEFSEIERERKLLVESTGHRSEFDDWWKIIKRTAKKYNEPGEFVTLLGYEWHGDRQKYGDNNIIYFGDEGGLDPEEELPDLYENLRGKKAFAIPHHIGYKVGWRGKDWDYWDEDLSPVAEIFSYHGSSETEPSRLTLSNNPSMGPGAGISLWKEGLDRGYRVGAIASNDGPGLPGGYGNGLAAVLAKGLTRDSLYRAVQERRTYAVTGDRIKLNYHLNGNRMGSVIDGASEINAEYSVRCPDVLDRVELIVNGGRVDSYVHIPEVDYGGAEEFNVRVDFGWGPAAQYGLEVSDLRWTGELSVEGGELTGVDGCFTMVGQKLDWDESGARWELNTRRSTNELNSELKQSLILKVRGDLSTKLTFTGDGYQFTKKIGDLTERSEVISLEEFAVRKIEENTGIDGGDVVNSDVFYFNAPKIKLHKASVQTERVASGTFQFDALQEGRNYAYLRVEEKNGQMAWSSPIWIDR